MRCGFLICSWFICQIKGHFHGSLRKRPEMLQRVSPLTTVYSDGASSARSAWLIRVGAAPRSRAADGLSDEGGMPSPSARTTAGTKQAEATTKVIIVFRMAALTCGYGARDPYSEKGLRPLFHVVQ